MLEKYIPRLAAGQPLTGDEVALAVEALVDAALPAAAKADFLSHLARKGETPEEIAAFVLALRDKAVRPPLDPAWRDASEILDVVGTGGDQLGTFNISTTAALVCAAAGVTVAKHGNRAATSRCGSADVLEALGVPVHLPPDAAAQTLREHGFAFFFAPDYHPAFRHVAAARKLCAGRGQRTIFNVLGPLLNPARPGALLVGVPRPELCEPLARVLQSLGVQRGMVVFGKAPGSEFRVTSQGEAPTRNAEPGTRNCVLLDELSTLGDSTIAEFYQERGLASSVLSPGQFPLQPASLADLLGGERGVNADIVRRLLDGEERGPKRDALLLNAGAALFVAGRARSITDGWTLAAEVIDSGRAQSKLAELVTR